MDDLALADVKAITDAMISAATLRGATCAIAVVGKQYPNGDRFHFVQWNGDVLQVAELYNVAGQALATSLQNGSAAGVTLNS